MSSATLVPAFSLVLSSWRRQPTTYRGPFVAFTITTVKHHYTNRKTKSKVNTDIAVRNRNQLTATGNHMPYGIIQCYLPPGNSDYPAFTPAEDGTQFSDPGGMQG